MPCRSSSLIAPVALRRDAVRLRSSSKKQRLAASVPRFGMQLRLRLARHLCGIMIPHARLIDIGSASQGALRMFVNAFDVTGRRAADRVEGRDGRRTARHLKGTGRIAIGLGKYKLAGRSKTRRARRLIDFRSHAQSGAAEFRGFPPMRISALLAAAVSFGLSVAAGNAASITVLSPGNLGPTSGATFNSITATTYSQTTPSGTFSDGGANFSGSGVVMNNGGQPSLGLYATPLGDATNYMAVLGGGSEKIAFSSQMNSLGLYWGSVDTYNFLEFFNGNTSVAMISGIDVQPPMLANGGQTDYASNGYVVIGALPFFDSVVVSSSANSFEFDNVLAGVGTTQFTAGVPEPSTWAMLLVGFAGLGYAGFRRSKGPISALA